MFHTLVKGKVKKKKVGHRKKARLFLKKIIHFYDQLEGGAIRVGR